MSRTVNISDASSRVDSIEDGTIFPCATPGGIAASATAEQIADYTAPTFRSPTVTSVGAVAGHTRITVARRSDSDHRQYRGRAGHEGD